MKKWADMANLPQEFQDKIDRLERNFAVSTVIFKKFRPIFLDIFQNPDDDRPKPPRSRKQRYIRPICVDIFWLALFTVQDFSLLFLNCVSDACLVQSQKFLTSVGQFLYKLKVSYQLTKRPGLFFQHFAKEKILPCVLPSVQLELAGVEQFGSVLEQYTQVSVYFLWAYIHKKYPIPLGLGPKKREGTGYCSRWKMCHTDKSIYRKQLRQQHILHPFKKKVMLKIVAFECLRYVEVNVWFSISLLSGNFSAISDDLVNSYHLLLCCIDWFYANALLSNRKDLLNPQFSGEQLPDHLQVIDLLMF